MVSFDNTYDVERNMTNHPPKDDTVIHTYEQIRSEFKELATLIDQTCPTSREKSLVFTNLEQALMWAIASIARKDY